jgi:hypothetical protein
MSRKSLLLSLSLVLSAYTARAEDLECKYEQRFKGGGSKQADLKIQSNERGITRLAVSSSYASGKEAGGYLCEIDTAGQDQIVKWDREHKKILLRVTYGGTRPSNVEIEPTANGYRINLEGASLDACGFGAAWPRSIEVSGRSKKCKVAFDN